MRVILVPVADRPESARNLRTAFDIGRRIDATVSGCHIRPHRYSDVSMSNAFADWRKKSTKNAPKAAQALYEEVAAKHGFEFTRRPRATPCAHWSEKVGSPDKVMGIVGPVADLVVVSRPKKGGTVADMFLNAALLETGRPVLVMPQSGRSKVGRRVCIGWNQTKEAANAVAAAMPILQTADEITIVSCGPEDHPGPKSTQLAGYLAHWGVKANRVNTRGRHIEDELMKACKDADADLLVAGAYSRSRWREKVFGGTTEFLLRKARLPVLIQHV